MNPIVIRRSVAFSAEQLFAVAADIEDYPNFLNNCAVTRIVEQQGDTYLVDNLFRWGPIPLRFRTRAVFRPPQSIEIETMDGEPVVLQLSWSFVEQNDETEVILQMALDLDIPFFDGLLLDFLREEAEATERSFLKRVEQLYGLDQSSKIEK